MTLSLHYYMDTYSPKLEKKTHILLKSSSVTLNLVSQMSQQHIFQEKSRFKTGFLRALASPSRQSQNRSGRLRNFFYLVSFYGVTILFLVGFLLAFLSDWSLLLVFLSIFCFIFRFIYNVSVWVYSDGSVLSYWNYSFSFSFVISSAGLLYCSRVSLIYMDLFNVVIYSLITTA